ncbi:hypothetical protein PR202_gb26163 [Eleusine coracana subsp. coracana]|uniref:Uncharacterized protein n=1 Tax=Eleusine coracana subsp. coracana TaxID=191504 RepID=A0AAV5FQI5_ELECO|nr:hypothetical protein PR202_gb26135 [Eleusine coracana subsp. coracana]GJN37232.1 hypothetical protein PR202_gb26163 [Eleusine coracana subsp. coracana]
MSPDIDSDDEGSEEWSPVGDQVELTDNRLGSPWSNETLGSPSIWPDERHGLSRLVPQNNRGSLRQSFSDRRSFRSDWLGVRRPSTQSLLHRGFSTRHLWGMAAAIMDIAAPCWIGPILVTYNAGTSRSLNDPSSWGTSRQQRLRHTRRSQY